MIRFARMTGSIFSLLLAARPVWLLMSLSFGLPAFAAEATVHHELSVRLVPAESRLIGVDTLTLDSGSWPPVLELNPAVSVSKVQVDGKPADFAFSDGRLKIRDEGAETAVGRRVTVSYQGIFDDPVPEMPVNTDNPGYGVSGTISEQGTFLLAGAGWYPQPADSRSTFTLSVTAPAGVVAVTAGSLTRQETVAGKTVCDWSVTRPVDGLSLSAARYVVRQKATGRVTAMTFMLPQNDGLSSAYLDAVAGYLADYETLFGPYPFSKFAVVENFFPTGYGFPSYTLLGSRVIRLPFIIRTSLGHEIAHCWWGNGVYVDYRQGNWCEGLTTYVADYRYKALTSPEEAREYRVQMLRNYAALVTPAQDFALSRFTSRTDPVTKVIGYDKGAMVFHMLRLRIGDDAFWQSLRDVYRHRLFQTVSWDDLKRAFEARSAQDLDRFFEQWVDRKGAPRLALEGVTVSARDGGWRVTGTVRQDLPAYELPLRLRLENGAVAVDNPLALSGGAADFEIFSRTEPERLSLDPEFDVFRQLYPEEIPPAVNALKGSGSVQVVLANGLPDGVRQAAGLLVRSLGLSRYEVVGEDQLDDALLQESDLLLIGWPGPPMWGDSLPASVRLSADAFDLNGTRYDQPGDVFFGVFRHPRLAGRVMAVFLCPGGAEPETAARKIAHYGRYSYLAFRRGENQDKGTWPTTASPLIQTFRSRALSNPAVR